MFTFWLVLPFHINLHQSCSLYSQLLQVVDWFHTAFIHTASHGDGFVEAPNVELIEPKVEPLSEEIKYRLFDLNILEADIHLVEGDAITRIQVSLTSCLLNVIGLIPRLHFLIQISYLH